MGILGRGKKKTKQELEPSPTHADRVKALIKRIENKLTSFELLKLEAFSMAEDVDSVTINLSAKVNDLATTTLTLILKEIYKLQSDYHKFKLPSITNLKVLITTNGYVVYNGTEFYRHNDKNNDITKLLDSVNAEKDRGNPMYLIIFFNTRLNETV